MRKLLKDELTPPAATMATQDHYSLRWNNHQNHILRAFDTLLQTKTLVDVTLVCAETSIRAHKMVLSACSPFFQRVFSETPCKHPVIVLKDFRGWVVQAIVDFMYRGEISVPQERLQTLIQAGESLQVRGLVENTVPGNTPTPAASPDDFGMTETSLLAPDLGRCSSYDDEPPPTMVSSSSKLILPSHVFVDDSHNLHHHSNPDLCTSPMPRRKQARPRRRSGECGPHDLSKPTSPTPDDNDSKMMTDICKGDERSKSVEHHNNRPSSSLDGDNNSHRNEMDNENSRQDLNSDGPENLCTKKDNDDSQNEDNANSISNSSLSNCGLGSGGGGGGSCSIGGGHNNNNNLNSLNNNNSNNNNNNTNNNNNHNTNNNNNNRIVLSLKDIRHLNKPPTIVRSPNPFHPTHLSIRGGGGNIGGGDSHSLKSESMEGQLDNESPFHMDQIDLSMAAAAAAAAQHHQHMAASGMLGLPTHPSHGHGHDRLEDVTNRIGKEYTPSSPMSLPSHFNPPDGPPHPPSPLPFPGMSSALGLTPPHMFGLDSSLGLFPPGMDPGKLYNPLMEMSDPRGLSSDHPPFLKKKMSRPKGQHSAPRGGPPRSWTNAELTEALQHVWNKKMTTSQASRIFGIPYNSLLMYVRGKYGKSLKLEQLRKDCISGPPIELLTMGMNSNNNNSKGSMNENRSKDVKDMDGPMQRSSSSEPSDMLSSPNPIFNPFPPGFYPDFPGGFPGLPLGMLNLLPPERHQPPLHMNMDEDCKSDRSKQSLEDDFPQPLALNRDERRELLQQNGQD